MPAVTVLIARLAPALAHASQSVWGMAEYIAYPLLMFIATPFFLYQLGATQYGQWMLLLTLNGVGGVAGLGMGQAAIKEVSAHRGRNDLDSAALSVRACLAVTLISSILLAALIVVLVITSAGSIFARIGDPSVVRRLLLFAVALITIEQIDTVFAGAIRGMERFDISAKIEIFSKFIVVCLSALAAWATRDLTAILWCIVIATVARALLKARIAAGLLKHGNLLPRWDRSYAAEAVRFGKWTWLQSMGGALFATADRLMVGALLGSTALAHYSVCLQLAQQVHTVPSAGAGFLFPLISRRIQAGESVRRVALVATLMFALGAGLLALPLVAFGHLILSLWIGRDFADANSAVLAWLTLAFVILALNIGPYFMLLGSGAARFVAWTSIAGGALALLGGYFLVPWAGLTGAAFMRIVYGVVICSNIAAMLAALGGREMTRRKRDPI